MRKTKWELTCNRCGKKFRFDPPDAISPDIQELLKNPLCPRCKLIRHILDRFK